MLNKKVLMMYTDPKDKGDWKDYWGVWYYRVVQPAQIIWADYCWNHIYHLTWGLEWNTEKVLTELWKRYDILHTKTIDKEEWLSWLLASCKYFWKKICLDLDDDLFNIDEWTYCDFMVKDGVIDRHLYEIYMYECDSMSVSTRELKKVCSPYKCAAVIGNWFDPALYKKEYIPEKENEKIRILWAWSISHELDIRMVTPALEEIQRRYWDKVEIYIVWYDSDSFRTLKYTFVTWVPLFTQYPEFLLSLKPDIALAPLIDSQFNRSKSCIKWYEMSFAWAPLVASNVLPYKVIRNWVTWYLANNVDEFVKYISLLIEDKELRKKIVDNAQREIIANHWVKKNEWELYFNNI